MAAKLTLAERDELETLRERNRQLEDLLFPKDNPLYKGLRLTAGERFLLAVLMNTKGTISAERFTEGYTTALPAVRVRIHRLRRKLALLVPPIEIVNASGQGYYMTTEDKARLAVLAVTTKGTI